MTAPFLPLAMARLRDRLSAERRGPTEPGFEIAQSMGIALLGLGVAVVFAGLLQGLGAEVIEGIRGQLGL